MGELEQFRQRVEQLAAVIGAPAGYLPTYGRTEDGARPHIEFANNQYHFVVVERGQELERVSSSNVDDILYQIFQTVTFSMACDYEVRHRRRGEDSRRQMFDVQLKLLGKLSPDWQSQERVRIDEGLRKNPFTDRL